MRFDIMNRATSEIIDTIEAEDLAHAFEAMVCIKNYDVCTYIPIRQPEVDPWFGEHIVRADQEFITEYSKKNKQSTLLPNKKSMPLFSGCLTYFPDALLAIAEHSKKGNEKYNSGERLHWAKDKSKDHADSLARHLVEIGPNWDKLDPELGSLHATALAWRALALLQTVLDRKKETE